MNYFSVSPGQDVIDPTHWLSPDALVSICMESDGVTLLQRLLEAEFAQQQTTVSRPLFSDDELREIYGLIPGDDCVNVIMTHPQRRLIAQYCACCYHRVVDAGQTRQARLLDEFMAALLEEATQITFQLWA